MINMLENIYSSSQIGNESGLGVIDANEHCCLFVLTVNKVSLHIWNSLKAW